MIKSARFRLFELVDRYSGSDGDCRNIGEIDGVNVD